MNVRAIVLTLAVTVTMICAPMMAQSASAQTQQHSAAYTSADKKIDLVQSDANGGKTQTVQFTADELNAYVNEGGVKLPTGVTNVNFSSTPGEVTAVLKVDFDKITAGSSSMNPLMMLFTGVHVVNAKAHASGENGRGTVNIESVQIDGMNVPRTALGFFVSRFIQPKYGNNIGMNSTFTMPSHIQTATVGENKLTVTQK